MPLGDKIGKWERALISVLEKESFGQIEEAQDDYQLLVTQLGNELSEENISKLSPDERACINKLRQCFYWRLQGIKEPRSHGTLTTADIQKLTPQFRGLFTGTRFPIDTTTLQPVAPPASAASTSSRQVPNRSDGGAGEDDDNDFSFKNENQGKLKPCPQNISPGDQHLRITIEKIGLKDASTYFEPFFRISVRTSDGGEIETSQETPSPGTPRKDKMVVFMHKVYVQTPLNRLPEDVGIFFEFCHWKPKKKKVSVRCWSLLTKEEIDKCGAGSLQLELYAKPADFKRKKFAKHSAKDYALLHISLAFLKG
eukprot:TRINITY_DN3603_c0_g1_i1.p1 TRINITY_DN3603_c0_g1~~TRINITY_DN3603_c0_g1_i1.p1  ORF type:complete len:311 (-),score=29.24 TRINITY_DN3603_c0_g1_i1:122-1054(-)